MMKHTALLLLCAFVIALAAETVLEVTSPDAGARWWTADDLDDWICREELLDETADTDNANCPENQDLTCNCGCGTYDPDCDNPTRFRPQDFSEVANSGIQCSPGGVTVDGRFTFCQRHSAACFTVPTGWTCEPKYYNQQSTKWYDDPETRTFDCHCGCGIWDPDCDDQSSDGVNVRCQVADGQAENYQVSHTDQVCTLAKKCMSVPETWTCNAAWYNEIESGIRRGQNTFPVCDCSCGAPDPDCDYEHKRTILGNGYFGLNCNGTLTTAATGVDSLKFCDLKTDSCASAPNGWTCPGRYYNEAATNSLGPNGIVDCHCGCGIWDPDCDSDALNRRIGRSGLSCGGKREDEQFPTNTDKQLRTYCDAESLECTAAPRDWAARCISNYYNEIGQGVDPSVARCDCGCSVWDPDCDYNNTKMFCIPDQYSSLAGNYACSPNTLLCRTSPTPDSNHNVSNFNEQFYGVIAPRTEPLCDCGAYDEYDPDCVYQTNNNVDGCNAGEFCNIENECQGQVPNGWTCDRVRYNEIAHGTFGPSGLPVCDCGCGVWDPDCDAQEHRYSYAPFDLLLECHSQAEEDVPVTDRTVFCSNSSFVCQRAPAAWTGAPMWFNETQHHTITTGSQASCHCGLGIWDPDCDNTQVSITRCGRGASLYSKKCSKSCPTCIPETTRTRTSSSSHMMIMPSVAVAVVVISLLGLWF